MFQAYLGLKKAMSWQLVVTMDISRLASLALFFPKHINIDIINGIFKASQLVLKLLNLSVITRTVQV